MPVYNADDMVRLLGGDKNATEMFYKRIKDKIKSCDKRYLEEIKLYVDLVNEQYKNSTLTENEYNEAINLTQLINWYIDYLIKRPTYVSKNILKEQNRILNANIETCGYRNKVIDSKSGEIIDIETKKSIDEIQTKIIDENNCSISIFIEILELFLDMQIITKEELYHNVHKLASRLIDETKKRTIAVDIRALILCSMSVKLLDTCFDKAYLSKIQYDIYIESINKTINEL